MQLEDGYYNSNGRDVLYSLVIMGHTQPTNVVRRGLRQTEREIEREKLKGEVE
jgi:hypothetical protein